MSDYYQALMAANAFISALCTRIEALEKEISNLRDAANPQWKGPDRKVFDTWEETRRAAQKRWEETYRTNTTPINIASSYTGIAGA